MRLLLSFVHSLCCTYDLNFRRDGNAEYTAEQYATELQNLTTTPVHQGICVRCMSDCDCPANQFCGYDYEEMYMGAGKFNVFRVTIPQVQSNNVGTGQLSADATRILRAYALQFEGLPIPSVCKDFGMQPQVWRQCDVNLELDPFAKMVQESLMTAQVRDLYETCDFSGTLEHQTMTRRTPKSWAKDAKDRFCGNILSWGPAFHNVTSVSAEQMDDKTTVNNADFRKSGMISTGDAFDDAARCTPMVTDSTPITCQSCLHLINPSGGAVDSNVNCLQKRDDRFCCDNPPVVSSWIENHQCGQYPRSDPAPEGTDTSAISDPSSYRSCEEACTRNAQHSYYPDCKSTAGEKTDAMTAAPGDDDAANTKTWCECVEKCMACVARNGGTGERPNVATMNVAYENVAFGICAPPPASWDPPAPTAVTPDTTVKDTEFTCASAVSQTCDAPAKLFSKYKTCKPACVDCLVAAAQHKCTNNLLNTNAVSACPPISMNYVLRGQCIGSNMPALAFTSSGAGTFQTSSSSSVAMSAMRNSIGDLFEFTVRSSPFEWTGVCHQGQV